MTDFLEATSLPVNVPIHRSREAVSPSHSMKEEYDRCTKQLPDSLATKLFHSPPQPCDGGRERRRENHSYMEEEEVGRRKRKIKKMKEEEELLFVM